MSASAQCPHPDWHFDIHHQAFHDSNLHYLEIKGRCTVCNASATFRGAPFGMTPSHPTMAADGSEMRLPFVPGEEELNGPVIGFVGRAVYSGDGT